MTTTYTNRSNAGRAARKALAAKHPAGALSQVHFEVVPYVAENGGDTESFIWREIDVETGRKAASELLTDAERAADFEEAAQQQVEQAAAARHTADDAFPPQEPARPLAKVEKVDVAKLPPPPAPPRPAPNQAKAQPAAPRGYALALEMAKTGKLPEPPVFTSATAIAKGVDKRLQVIVDAAKAGDVAQLQAINARADAKDSLVAAMGRYRELCIVALQAQAELV